MGKRLIDGSFFVTHKGGFTQRDKGHNGTKIDVKVCTQRCKGQRSKGIVSLQSLFRCVKPLRETPNLCIRCVKYHNYL